MVYVISIFGFIGGFAAGLFIIQFFLRGKSNKELKTDKGLHWKYGIIPWAMAVLGAYSGMMLWTEYFY